MMNIDRIIALDRQLALWLHLHAAEPLTSLMLGVSLLHEPVVVLAVVALFAAWLWRREAHYWVLALVVTVPGGMLLNVLLKYVFQRSRPVFEHPLVTLSTYSFPSGHAAAATLLYGFVACFLVMEHRGKPAWVLPACALMVLLVAASRMVLGAHYLSDVLAAMLEGLAWLALCLGTVGALRRRRLSAKP